MNNKNMLFAALILLIGGSSVMDGMDSKYIKTGLYEINLKELVELGLIAEIGHLIDKGINPDKILILAGYYESVPIVKFLLEQGANPNAKDENGNTPLHCVIKQNSKHLNKNQTDIVKLLIEYGANPLVNNKQKESVMKHSSLPNTTKKSIGLYAEKNFTIKSKF